MRKGIYFSLLAFTLCVFVACFASQTPGQVAKKNAEYLANGQYEKFIDGIAFDENASKEDIKEQKEMILSLLEKGKESIDGKDGLAKVDVISEVIAEDGNSAKVLLKQTYKNGDSEESGYDMVKKNGRWKMVIKK